VWLAPRSDASFIMIPQVHNIHKDIRRRFEIRKAKEAAKAKEGASAAPKKRAD
jgi:hypothetical protein